VERTRTVESEQASPQDFGDSLVGRGIARDGFDFIQSSYHARLIGPNPFQGAEGQVGADVEQAGARD